MAENTLPSSNPWPDMQKSIHDFNELCALMGRQPAQVTSQHALSALKDDMHEARTTCGWRVSLYRSHALVPFEHSIVYFNKAVVLDPAEKKLSVWMDGPPPARAGKASAPRWIKTQNDLFNIAFGLCCIPHAEGYARVQAEALKNPVEMEESFAQAKLYMEADAISSAYATAQITTSRQKGLDKLPLLLREARRILDRGMQAEETEGACLRSFFENIIRNRAVNERLDALDELTLHDMKAARELAAFMSPAAPVIDLVNGLRVSNVKGNAFQEYVSGLFPYQHQGTPGRAALDAELKLLRTLIN
ncbi:MAG TPA: hypothetical protein VHB73_03300, partial [Alphaproteobacteria bacterium]|nr:hypothetical protein [Alphaproteobacteria bacterium]